MSRLWRTEYGGGKRKIEYYFGRPETTKTAFASKIEDRLQMYRGNDKDIQPLKLGCDSIE